MPKAFKIEQTGDRQSNQIQDNIKQATNTLRSGPFGDGNLVKRVYIPAATGAAVEHGLGRAYEGYIVVRQTGSATALVEMASQTDRTKYANLIGFYDTYVDIWFF